MPYNKNRNKPENAWSIPQFRFLQKAELRLIQGYVEIARFWSWLRILISKITTLDKDAATDQQPCWPPVTIKAITRSATVLVEFGFMDNLPPLSCFLPELLEETCLFRLWFRQQRAYLRSNAINYYLKLIGAICFNSILFEIRLPLNWFSFIARKFTTILFTPFTHCLGLNNHIFGGRGESYSSRKVRQVREVLV